MQVAVVLNSVRVAARKINFTFLQFHAFIPK